MRKSVNIATIIVILILLLVIIMVVDIGVKGNILTIYATIVVGFAIIVSYLFVSFHSIDIRNSEKKIEIKIKK